MAEHNRLGNWGERVAASYLLKQGYTIRDTNWRSGRLELDIVAELGSLLVIVEVKTRSSDQYEFPEEAVTEKKIRRIIRAAEAYIRRYDLNRDTRFDIISVIGEDESDYRIEHLPDAFFPTR